DVDRQAIYVRIIGADMQITPEVFPAIPLRTQCLSHSTGRLLKENRKAISKVDQQPYWYNVGDHAEGAAHLRVLSNGHRHPDRQVVSAAHPIQISCRSRSDQLRKACTILAGQCAQANN